MIQTIRKTQLVRNVAVLDDDGTDEELDAFEAAATMMKDLRNRKELGLGKYYQMLQKHEIDADDLRDMLNQMKYEASQYRKGLRAEIQRGLERGRVNFSVDLMVFQESRRELSLPEKENKLLVVQNEEKLKEKREKMAEIKQKNEEKLKRIERSNRRQQKLLDQIYVVQNATIVDPLAELSKQIKVN